MRPVPAQISSRLLAAAPLFADQGLDNTKIEDVVAAVGIPKATLYYYFASKEEILAFLLQDMLRRIADEVDIAVSTPGTAADRLTEVIRAQLRMMLEQPAICRALIGDLGRAGRIPEIAAALNDAYYRPVRALLVEGAEDASLRAMPDPTAAAATVFGAVTISALAQIFAADPVDPGDLARTVTTLLLDGLLPES